MTQVTINPQVYETLSFKKVIEFVTGNIKVRFIPESNAPGYSYMVVVSINDTFAGKEWMPSDQKPTQKNAEFYYNKIVNKVYKY